ncbi:kinase-like domain-containing protein [Fusarium solani]|uniref:Kinase-like domain-containing protein n=1 Tax=Fusarium solani TaxID=169388 RepID=A0A9P9KCX1_FUSSL|nr:kinase-like domain-containing protein [Fusarium solani]KAH7248414.1 kinase-like domain-containing protein [Fusarium solani]
MSRDARPLDACPESLTINNTPLRRFLTLLGLKTTARLFHHRGACVPISKHLIVKSDSFVDLTEAATMRFVATNTSVPVPKVWCSFVHNGRTYIVMERIQGDCISRGWDDRSKESKDKLLAQLKLMMQELRSLQPLPGMGVESCTGGPLFDSRIPRADRRFGPFKTIQEFHLWLRDNFQPLEVEKPGQATQEDWKDVKDMAARQDGPWPRPVFTHGDLNPSNILVRGDEIVGIIDWEFSVGPKVEDQDVVHGMRYHVKNPISQGWMYEEVELRNVRTTGNLLVRILIAKVRDEERLANIFRNVPIVQDDPNWRCRSWVANALAAVKEDGRAVGRAELDWGNIENVARRYAGEKTEAGRFRDVALAQMPKPTWDMLENREIVP